jgi:hypothetical protein
MSRDVIDLTLIRERRQAEREDVVAPIRAAYMEEMGELLTDFIDAVAEATGNDPDKIAEETLAAWSALLAITAEQHSADEEERIDFIDSVAEIAVELLEDDAEADDDADGEDGTPPVADTRTRDLFADEER